GGTGLDHTVVPSSFFFGAGPPQQRDRGEFFVSGGAMRASLIQRYICGPVRASVPATLTAAGCGALPQMRPQNTRPRHCLQVQKQRSSSGLPESFRFWEGK
ncbi:hypothetical protein RA19_10440, partial [Leisingera sp. ANG-M1]